MPREHTAVNLALYRGGKQVAWVMSEYHAVECLNERRVAIGGATLEREPGGRARVTLVDRITPFMTFFTGPLGARVEGEIDIEPLTGPMAVTTISGGNRSHAWQALAPRARVRARFSHPDFRFESDGYFDRNHGDGRLEDAFSRWGWARFHGPSSTTVIYACEGIGGAPRVLLAECPDGGSGVAPVEAPAIANGPERKAGWGLRMPSRYGTASLGCSPSFLLERSPFYCRYGATLDGSAARGPTVGLGEWLDLDRFRSRWHQFLLRYKTRE